MFFSALAMTISRTAATTMTVAVWPVIPIR
nr:MAG TPA: hypothetical protein [Caudoviricetes sp.]